MNQTTNTAEVIVSSTKEEIIKEAKRIEESALYSTKGHLTACRIWTNFHLCLGVLISILSAITAGFIFSESYYLWVGILSLTISILSAITTFFNPNDRARTHLEAGNSYYSLGNRSRIFWTIDCWAQEADDKLLTQQVKDLSEEKSKLNSHSPQIPKWAYLLAKRGIEAGEADFAVDRK